MGLDATPLLGPRTGVGRYVAGLVDALAHVEDPPELVLTPFTWRGIEGLPALRKGRRAPARALQLAWGRGAFPPVEWLSGGVDVFHGTNFVAPPSRRAGRVVTVHDLSFLHHAETVQSASLRYRRLVPRAIESGAVVCALTSAMADEISDAYGVDARDVVVTNPGVDDAWFAATPPSARWLTDRGLPERYVLAVGSLEPRKGLHRLVAAMASLHADDADFPALVLVGPPGWGPALDASGLPRSAVHLPGYLPDDALRSLVAGAACLAYPSQYEGFGLPPLEALAAGTPVVASDLPAVHEVLGDHVHFVPRDDIGALAAALASVVTSPPDERAQREAREHARQYTWLRCAEQTMQAYRRAMPG